MEKLWRLAIGVVIAGSFVSVRDAQAYGYFACSTDGKYHNESATVNGRTPVRWRPPLSLNSNAVIVPLVARAADIPEGPWRNAVSEAIDLLNNNASNFRYSLSFADLPNPSLTDGKNGIWFAPPNPDISATSYQQFGVVDCARNAIVESDVIVTWYDDQPGGGWTPWHGKNSLDAYNSTRMPLASVLMHELGHGAGLDHEEDAYNIMGNSHTHLHHNGIYAGYYFGVEAGVGLANLYGWRSRPGSPITGTPASTIPVVDFSVSPWRYYGHDSRPVGHEATSEHARTRVRINGGADYARWTWDGTGDDREYIHLVPTRGDTVKVEFTFEHNGNTVLSEVDVDYYFSPNKLITYLDMRAEGTRVTGFRWLTVNPGFLSQYFRTIALPTSLPSGRGNRVYFGVLVDKSDKIVEVSESDSSNGTFLTLGINWGISGNQTLDDFGDEN